MNTASKQTQDPLAGFGRGGVRHPRAWAHVPGVMYPKQGQQPQPAKRTRVAATAATRPAFSVPAGCPALVRTVRELGPWLIAAGLWAGNPPHVVTMRKWLRAGLIVTVPGAGKRPLINVPASLLQLYGK